MQFSYPEIESFSLNGMRFYETPRGDFYPSITTVLGKTQSEEKILSLQSWRDSLGHEEADRITEEAANNGTGTHLLAERYLNKEELIKPGEKFSKEAIDLFNCIKPKLNKVTKVYGQEVALYSNRLAVAGRCDCIGVYMGKLCIIDFKTSRRIKNKKDIEDYRMQLCAYAIMHNEMFGTNIVDGIIIMASTGIPQEFKVYIPDEVNSLLKRINQFYSTVSV